MSDQLSKSMTLPPTEEKTCLIVTGAAGWLGRAVIESSSNRNDIEHVIAVCRRKAGPSSGGKLLVLQGSDLATQPGIDTLRSAVEATASTRIALLHCAGAFPPAAPVHKIGIERLADSFASNVVSLVGALEATLPAMRRRRHGRVVAFSSHTRKEAYPFFGAFNIAKAGLETAIQTTANENARFGIVANTISVATLQTEEERTIKPSGTYSDWLPPHDVSEFALNLAFSKDAALNGSNLHYWLYSRSFFGSSVFDRNSIDLSDIDPD